MEHPDPQNLYFRQVPEPACRQKQVRPDTAHAQYRYIPRYAVAHLSPATLRPRHPLLFPIPAPSAAGKNIFLKTKK